MKNPGHILRLLRLERNVSELFVAIEFYREALGFSVIEQKEQIGKLQLGAQHIWLIKPDMPGLPYPENSTSSDIWFQHAALVTSNMADSFARLQRHGHRAISCKGPQQLPKASGGVSAYKFRDPDGHPLELIYFPVDAGDAQWQSSASLNMGIDHSAISVSNMEQSIAFYHDVLSMTVTARQKNSGIEQDNLDALSDDIVEVVALMPALELTPHLELLAYNSPKPLHPIKNWQPCDVVSDRLVFEVDNLNVILGRMNSDKFSENILMVDSERVMIRDPDGHLLILMQIS
jgi:catechol 2,3-dioxygenase-like lactoylglutathione lyase family enzyme